MEYLKPNIIVVDSQKLAGYIKAYAYSDDGCGAIGCPDIGYQSTENPCSGNHNFETCEPDPANYDTRLNGIVSTL